VNEDTERSSIREGKLKTTFADIEVSNGVRLEMKGGQERSATKGDCKQKEREGSSVRRNTFG
jgi:hypothetical protein